MTMTLAEWMEPNPANPWGPFVTDRMALEIIEASIERLKREDDEE